MCHYGRAHWCYLVTTIEPSVCCSDVALCQITLTTCYYYSRPVCPPFRTDQNFFCPVYTVVSCSAGVLCLIPSVSTGSCGTLIQPGPLPRLLGSKNVETVRKPAAQSSRNKLFGHVLYTLEHLLCLSMT